MLKENIKEGRKLKGLSQEELAIRLSVVRQTVSKWEQGLSVPDSEMLISISEVLDIPISTLLGESITESEVDNLKAISEKLEVINFQLSQKNIIKRKTFHWIFILICSIIVLISVILVVLNSSYLGWNFDNPETAIVGTVLHAFEWLFVRLAPITLVGGIIGIIFTRERNK